jgi:hypothetical protein
VRLDTLYVLGLLALGDVPRRDALDPTVAGVDVVDEKSDAALAYVIADAGGCHVEESPGCRAFDTLAAQKRKENTGGDGALEKGSSALVIRHRSARL